MVKSIITYGEVLHRSVGFGQLDGEEVSMEAFNPTSRDEYRLSVDRNKVWTARCSYEYRTKILERRSAGIWSLDSEVFISMGLECSPNRVDGNDAHSLVNFNVHDKRKRADIARRLAHAASNIACSPLETG